MARVCSFIFFLLLVHVCSTSIALTQFRMLGSYGSPPDSLGYTHPLGGWTYVAGYDSTGIEDRFSSSGDTLAFELQSVLPQVYSVDGGKTFDTTSFIRNLYTTTTTGKYWNKGGHGWAIVLDNTKKLFGSYVFSDFGKNFEYYPFSDGLSSLFSSHFLYPSVYLDGVVRTQPTNENVIFIKVSSSSQNGSVLGYLTSRDGGKSWNFISIPNRLYQVTNANLILNYRNPNKFVLHYIELAGGPRDYLIITTDNGKTWKDSKLYDLFTGNETPINSTEMPYMYGIRDEDEIRSFKCDWIQYSRPYIQERDEIYGIVSNQVGVKDWRLDLYKNKLQEYNTKYSVCSIVPQRGLPQYWIDPADPKKAIIQIRAVHDDTLGNPRFQENSLYHTSNDGETWQRIMYYQFKKETLLLSDAKLSFNSDLKSGYIAIHTSLATYNDYRVTIWKYTPEIVTVDRQVEGQISSFEIGPNPSSEQTYINFTVEKPIDITIEVFDMQGIKVAEVFKGSVSADRQVLLWNGVQELANGVYNLVLHHGNSTQSKRLVVCR